MKTSPRRANHQSSSWEIATNALINALQANNLEYEVDPGGGAFYGPKIDIKVKDAIGRLWQCPTIQCDFNLPERFGLEYQAADGTRQRPVMIHRALLGSIERFMGIIIEEYGGAFPLWLAPMQVVILPIADRHHEYSHALAERLRAMGVRVNVDTRNEKTGFKIREAQVQKIPYMLVVGDREAEAGAVSVRQREEGDLGSMAADDFLARISKELTD